MTGLELGLVRMWTGVDSGYKVNASGSNSYGYSILGYTTYIHLSLLSSAITKLVPLIIAVE